MKLYHKYILLFSIILFSTNVQSQTEVLSLTKDQMYEDFDYFVDIENSFDPEINRFKDKFDYDINSNLEIVRKQIDTAKTVNSFLTIMNTAFKVCNNPHTSYFSQNSFKYIRNNDDELFYLSDTIFNNKNDSIIRAWRMSQYSLNKKHDIPVTYKQGNYLLYYDIKVGNKRYPAGSKIIKLNNIATNQFLKKNSFGKNRYWDYKNKEFYYSFKTIISEFDDITLTIIRPDSKEEEKIKIDFKNTKVKSKGVKLISKYDHKQVHYYKESKVLFIDLPSMSNLDFYRNEIKEIQAEIAENGLEKVIIDIRGNGGGNDYVWIGLMQFINKEDFIIHDKIAMKKNDFLLKAKPELKNKPIFDYYNEKYICVKDSVYTFKSKDEGLKFDKNIFILQNRAIFSSSLSFSSMAINNNKIIRIGEPSHYQVGYGVGSTPSIFMLPNSKFLFRMATSLDISKGIENHEELNTVDIEVPFTIEQLIRKTKAYNVNSEKFLFEKDEAFMKAVSY